MPIPRTRSQLLDQVTTSYDRLRRLLDEGGDPLATLTAVDNWSVKDLLAVRAWWTESVLKWIQAWRRGQRPVTPAPGYQWRETPRLNDDLARAARKASYRSIRRRLDRGYRRVIATIDALDDLELLRVGTFPPAGKWPVSRWISINTARQYTTAAAYVRRALRERQRSRGSLATAGT